jgi:hypothetical protein
MKEVGLLITKISKIPIDLLKSGSNLKKFERFVSFKRISSIG